jgi:hypothetical protein
VWGCKQSIYRGGRKRGHRTLCRQDGRTRTSGALYSCSSASSKRLWGSLVAFFGRPSGRRLDSKPSRWAVNSCHGSVPNGRPRRKLSRRDSTSASVCGWLTHCRQLDGRATGPGWSFGQPARGVETLDHFQSSARSTSPARSGLRSI